MRDTSFKGYAALTRRELVGLGKKLHDVIEARSSSPPRPERPADDPPSIDETTRTPFARELGDDWIEVTPGIYELAPSQPAEPVLRTSGS